MKFIQTIKNYFQKSNSKKKTPSKINLTELDEIKLTNDWQQINQDMYVAIRPFDTNPKSKK